MTTWPNIGLQRTSACGLAAEAGSLGGEGRIVSGLCFAWVVIGGSRSAWHDVASHLDDRLDGQDLLDEQRAEAKSTIACTKGLSERVYRSLDLIPHDNNEFSQEAGDQFGFEARVSCDFKVKSCELATSPRRCAGMGRHGTSCVLSRTVMLDPFAGRLRRPRR
jgi:hypothetical protein